MNHWLAVGDRVRIIKPLDNIDADRVGTIVQIFAPGFYGVQIDGEMITRILADDHVALVPHSPKEEQLGK
jgi:hypothetical protein